MGRRVDRGESLLVAQVAHPAGLDVVGSVVPASIRIRRAVNRWGWRGFLAIVFLALFGPLAILVAFSFNDSSILAFPFDGLTVKWYTAALQDPSLRQALVNSFAVACIVAPLCLVLGTLAAFGLTQVPVPRTGLRRRARRGPARAAVADHRDRGVDGLRAREHRPEFEDRDRHADDLHVPVGDSDRRGAALQVPARPGRGRDRSGLLAAPGPAAHHPAAHRAGAHRRGDLRVHVVVQQLRDQRVHDRVPADLPDLGLLLGPESRSHRGRERDLDVDLGGAGAADLPRHPAAAVSGWRGRHRDDRDAAGGAEEQA